MNVYLIKPSEGISYNITQAVESVTWSGSVFSAGRTAEISYVNAPMDKSVNIPRIAMGDFLALEDESTQDNPEIFYGQFFGIERSSDTGTISYTAFDMMKNLLESTGKYNFKNITPEAVAAQVCADIQVPVGNLAATGINIQSMLCDSIAYYDIIMGAYTRAYKMTGKKYLPMVWRRKFCVYEAVYEVSNFVLSDELNITQASISESMGSIKNKIVILDNTGNQIGEITDNDSMNSYGTFQEIYEQEEGVDALTAAKQLLKTLPEQEISVSVIGDLNCQSGYAVTVQDSATGLTGRYWIKSDKHIWKDGIYTMDLELSFEKLMDEVEIEEEVTT